MGNLNNCLLVPLVVTTLSILIGILLLLNSSTLKTGEIFLCIGAGGVAFFMLYHLLKYIIGKRKKPENISVEFFRFPSRNISMDAISMDSDVVLFDITKDVPIKSINTHPIKKVRFNNNTSNLEKETNQEEQRYNYKFIQPVEEVNQLRIPRRKISDPFNLDDISDDLMLELNKKNISSSDSSII
jgi:hypothetical protein